MEKEIMFIVQYDIEINKIYIKCDANINAQISIYKCDNENDHDDLLKLIYQNNLEFNNNELWISTYENINTIAGIKVFILCNNTLIKKYFNFKQKSISVYFYNKLGLGDAIWTTPFIRKLSKLYDRKIDIYGYEEYRDFFKNNIYVGNYYNNSHYNINLIDKNNDNFIIFKEYDTPYIYSDLRQLSASSIGMTLKEEELELDYFPEKYIDIDLPKDYILINPRSNLKGRSYSLENYQKLVDMINNYGVPVVTIGVEPSEHHKLNIKNGVNLVFDNRQNSLSQTWHIINNSKVFITFDTGIYVFAGTTDANILLNGWNCDPWYHQPYRNGSRNYKFSTVRGDCDIYCCTDPKSNILINNTIKLLHVSNDCILNIDYKCIPTPEQIIEKLKIIGWLK
jgi:hypothetical protein